MTRTLTLACVLFLIAAGLAALGGCSELGCLDPFTVLSDCPAGTPGHRS